MLNLDRFEQTLEVSRAKSLVVVPLDDLEEQSGSVLNRLGEDLEKIALLVIIYEDFKLLQGFNVLLHLNASMLQAFAKSLIIGIGNSQELYSSIFECSDSLDDIWSRECDVLNTSSSVVIAELLNLRFTLTISRFIDGHLYFFVKISDDN